MSTFGEKREELLVLRAAYRRLFKTLDGQLVLADLMTRWDRGKALRPSPGQPLDPLQAVWNEGAREPVRWITLMLSNEGDTP